MIRRCGTGAGRFRRRSERGAAAVEFALISMVLMTLMFGILQYGWYFFSTQAATSGTREAARQLSVGDCQGTDEAEKYAQEQSNLSSLTLEWGPVGAPAANSMTGMDIGDVLVVTAQADGGILGFLPMPNGGQIERQVKVRLEDLESSGTC